MQKCGWIIILAVMLSIAYLVSGSTCQDKKEGFNDQAGRFCPTCSGKTINQCLRCFNCGWCVDKYGNSGCIGGDHNGPFNKEKCARWYNGDPFSEMLKMDKKYRCSYGPHPGNSLAHI